MVKAQLLWTNDLNEAEIGALSTPREAVRRDQDDDDDSTGAAMPILFFHGGCNAMTGQIFDLSCKRQTFSLEHNFGKFIVSYWMNSMVVNDGYDLHFKYHSPNWSTIWANSAQNIQT